MKLFTLLKNLNFRVLGNLALDITGLYHKDTEVKSGGLFFCLKGTNVDGNDFVFSAIKNGAVAIVGEKEIHGISGITQIIVKNARESMSKIACRFYGCPANKLKIIGVTGTNGKTTTTHMLASILEHAEKKVAIVGTNGIIIKGQKIVTNMTTPDPIELQKYFALMLKHHIEYVCMEVSAHASALSKVDGVHFEAMIFTNLTEDHLDFFKTMDNYFAAKLKLFNTKYTKLAILNKDDSYYSKIKSCINLLYFTYSKVNDADFVAEIKRTSNKGQEFTINNTLNISLPMLGFFNVSNALAAIATLSKLGFSNEEISSGLKNIKQVDGRFNSYDINGKTVIIDYAHTPDGLENILIAAREIAKKNKLFVVFGCGGNRDALKRPIMGKIASKLCDYVFISNDNPRFENPLSIAKDIAAGISKTNYEIELNRSDAIKKAINLASDNSVIVIAGKGAEDYMEENGIKIPYSDLIEIEKIRRNL